MNCCDKYHLISKIPTSALVLFSAPSTDQTIGSGKTEASSSSRRNSIELKGRNTFAMPRSVAKPLGWTPGEGRVPSQGEEEEKPKSNDEFKELLLKK